MPGLTRLLPPSRVDLSEGSGFLLDLLDEPNRWRERVVQELQFASQTHVRLVSSYQVDFPPALLERHVGLRRTTRANVLLPVTRRDKAPLLNFSLAGPGGAPAALISRASTAGLQAQYLSLLAQTSSAAPMVTALSDRVYEAIGAFTPGRFKDFLGRVDADYERALVDYLRSGTKLPVKAADVARWRRRTVPAGEILVDRLGEPSSVYSCSEELLLAVPRLDSLPASIDDVDDLVGRYLDAVRAADRNDDGYFLFALAEYGRRFDLIVEVEVPLLEPCTLKIEEDLPLELSRDRWMVHTFPFGDARSAHLEARTLDPAVEIEDFELVDLNGHDASGWIESVRPTRDAVAIYSSEPGRPYFVNAKFRLTLADHLLNATSVLVLANLVAFAAIVLIERDGSYVDRLAVLAIPTTVAAAFVLTREQTGLATRLQGRARALLATTTLAVWFALVGSVVFVEERYASAVRPDGGGKSLSGERYDGPGKEASDGQERSTR